MTSCTKSAQVEWPARHLISTKGGVLSRSRAVLNDDTYEDSPDCKSARKGVICFLAR